MKPEIKKLWVDALQSGSYEKGCGNLRAIGPSGKCEYCALGVLCDLYVKAHEGQPEEWIGQHTWHEYEDNYGLRAEIGIGENDETAMHTHTGCLPPQVIEWAGLHSEDPVLTYDWQATAISELNDVDGLPFDHLAVLIRDQMDVT